VTLDDCDVQAFQAGGKGGQHQNHSNTGVRVVHRASGAVGVSRTERSQLLNKRNAFRRMAESGKFRAWVNRQVWENGRDMEAEVRRTMQPHNLLIEGRTADGGWRVIG
jgi:protein subunit release factor B